MQHSMTDAYAEALIIQNKGGVCPYCKSALGHYSYCGLLNREIVKRSNGSIWASPEHNVRTNKAEAKAAQERGGFVNGGYLFTFVPALSTIIFLTIVVGGFNLVT